MVVFILCISIFLVNKCVHYFADVRGVKYCHHHVCISVCCIPQKPNVQTSQYFLYVDQSSAEDNAIHYADDVRFSHSGTNRNTNLRVCNIANYLP